MKTDIRIALVGNPNTGKSTLFNVLTGLNQKVGNFPGVTVDKKTGTTLLPDGRTAEIVDLPGTYSLYPKSADERIVFSFLADKNSPEKADIVVVIVDATNLKRNMLLYTQVADLKIPVVLALNMTDMANRQGIKIAVDDLAKKLGVPVIPISARSNTGITKLKETLAHNTGFALQNNTIDIAALAPELVDEIGSLIPGEKYMALQMAHQHEHLDFIDKKQNEAIEAIEKKYAFHSQKTQAAETIARYNFINDVLYDTVTYPPMAEAETWSNRIDKILTHRFFGFFLFFVILLFIFQSIFSWSAYPMALIENLFSWSATKLHEFLPEGPLTNLLVDGVVAGLSGVLVFIPQIAILFGFISILEDTGYMARVTFMMDKVMRKVGLNGKSVVPLIGGFACAVPSIMSTRNIESWKDRMITILVVPLTTCSARLPVYVLLISLVVPDKTYYGFLHLQGVVLMSLYVLSIVTAILVAWVLKFILKSKERGYFIMELPVYRMPRWSNVFITMYERSKTFVVQAGKVIIAVSIILWVLSSYGPPGSFRSIEDKYQKETVGVNVNKAEIGRQESSEKLEASFAGVMGRAIEPVIRPLGFDWKIGIALITSFAAREVFVGTVATIYSVENVESDASIRQKMADAKWADTGKPIYTTATAFSLMVFYAFAMQCMSTLAIVYRETKSWKWPAIQFAYMSVLAYVASFITYQLLV